MASSPTNRLHALLIGIDAYEQSPLAGCVNDVNAVEAWLTSRAGVRPEELRKLIAPRGGGAAAELPTLSNIRRALEALASDTVAEGDRVFFYYSGHGVREMRVDGEGRRGAREALVPLDAWLGDGSVQLLFDAEVNALLQAIRARKAHITCVFDCCHSAGVVRQAPRQLRALEDSAVRGLELGQVVVRDEPELLGTAVATTSTADGWAVIMACEAAELSREAKLGENGERHGVFTYALLQALNRIPVERVDDVEWSEVWYSLLETVAIHNTQQHPRQLSAWNRPLLGGTPRQGDPGIPVRRRGATGGYEIAAGRMAGLGVDSLLAVYGPLPAFFPPLGSVEDLAARLGTLRVAALNGASSSAAVASGAAFDVPAGARARPIAAKDTLRVRIEFGDALVEQAFAGSRLIESCSADAAEDAWLARVDPTTLVLGDDLYDAGDVSAARTLLRIPNATSDRLRAVLEHYRAYSEPLRVARRCRDYPGALVLEVLDCNDVDALAALSAGDALQAPRLSAVDATPQGSPALKVQDKFCVRVTNAAPQELSVALFCCTVDGRVEALGEQAVPGAGQAVWWQGDVLGNPFVSSLPDDREVAFERLVAIGTTVRGVSFQYLELSTPFAAVLRAPLRGGDRAVRLVGAAAPPPPERWTGTVMDVYVER